MLRFPAVALAAALLCWPAETGRLRLMQLYRRRGRATTSRSSVPRRRGLLLIALAAAVGTQLAGPAGTLAAAMAAGTATAGWRGARDRRAAAAATTGLSDVLGVLVTELRAGAHPGDAVRAAADAHAGGLPGTLPDAARALAVVAAAARFGGDVPAALRSTGPAPLRSWLARIADAWSLADRYGIPLADLLDAVRSDTEHRVRFAAEVQARLAGPRATAAVLAGLPLLGLALGQVMGAAPLRVLGETLIGQVLLVIGTTLACAGVLWSARLVSGAVPA